MQTSQDRARADVQAFDAVVTLAREMDNACHWRNATVATDALEENAEVDATVVLRVIEFGLYMALAEPNDKDRLCTLVRARYGDAPWKAARVCRSFYSATAAAVTAEFLTALPSDAHHEVWADLFLNWWESGDSDKICTPEHDAMLKKWLAFDWGAAAAHILAEVSDASGKPKNRKRLFAALDTAVPRKFYGLRLTEEQKNALKTNEAFRYRDRAVAYLRSL